jgi:hypothetical protein
MRIFVLTATYEFRVSRKSHLRDHPTFIIINHTNYTTCILETGLLHVKEKYVEGLELEPDSETGIIPVVWIAGVVDEREGRVRDSSNPPYAVLLPVLSRLLHLTSMIS